MSVARTVVIVVAAGSGSRFGSDVPKQFCLLAGRPVAMHAIDALRRALPEAEIIIALSPAMVGLWYELCREYSFKSPEICLGGATRWHSVANGLRLAAGREPLGPECIVGVHDAARPLVDSGTVGRAYDAVAAGAQGAIPAVAVTDSLRLVEGEGSRAVDRSRYRAVQTPQFFNGAMLAEAYAAGWREEFTDDASVMEAAGFRDLVLTEGSPTNIKITNPADLAVAGLLMNIG